MNLINKKNLILALILGLISFLIIYSQIFFTIPGTNILTDPREIFVMIGSALTGPISGLIVGLLASIYDPSKEMILYVILQHLLGSYLIAIMYKKLIFEKLPMPFLILGWIGLVFCYYFVFNVPIRLLTFYLYPNFYFSNLGSSSFTSDLFLIYKAWIPEFILTSLFTTLILITLPENFRNPLWGKLKFPGPIIIKILGKQINTKDYFKNSLVFRLSVWFIMLALFPIVILNISITKEFSKKILEHEAKEREIIAKNYKQKFLRLSTEKPTVFLADARNSVSGRLFIIDSSGNYVFVIDSLKQGKSANIDYPKSVINEICKLQNGKLINLEKKLSLGFASINRNNQNLFVVAVSDSSLINNELITFENILNSKLLILILSISFSLVVILWLLIKQPVKKINNTVNKIGQGDLSLRINVDALNDEIKTLGSALNLMADKVTSSEIKFRTIIEQFAEGFILINNDGIITIWNKAAEEISGISSDLAINHYYWDILFDLVIPEHNTPERYEYLKKSVQLNLKKSDSAFFNKQIEAQFMRKDGKIGIMQQISFPIIISNQLYVGAVVQEVTEKKKAEKVLKESEERFRILVENIQDPLVIISFDGVIRFANLAACKLVKYPSTKDLVGKNISIFITSDQIEKAKKDLMDLEHNGELLLSDYKVITTEGDIRWVEASGNKITFENMDVDLITIRDITERKKVEKELRESEQKARAIFDLSFSFIGLLNSDGILLEANRTALEFVGTKAAEVIGKPFWETPWWSHSPEMQNLIKTSIKNASEGTLVRSEAVHPAKDGSPHFIDFTLKPVKDETAKVKLIIAEGRDITERKKAEEILIESEERFNKAFQLTPTTLAITEIDNGKIIDVNEQGIKLFGYSKEEYFGRTIEELQLFNEPQVRLEEIKKLKTDGNIRNIPVRFRAKSGEFKETLWSAEIISLQGRNVMLSLIFDITDRKLIEEQLKQSEEKFRSFVEQSTDGLSIVDKNGRVIEWNKTQVKITGIERDKAVGMYLWDIQYKMMVPERRKPEVFNDTRQAILSAISTGTSPFLDKSFEVELVNAKEKHIYILQNSFVIKTQSENYLGTIISDITLIRESQIALKESEERFRLTIEQTDHMVYDLDYANSKTIWNGASEKLTGYSIGEIRNIDMKKWIEFIHPDDRIKAFEVLKEVESGISNYHFEYRFKKKDGSYIYLEDNGAVIQNNLGKPARLLGSLKDITERKLNYEKEQIRIERIERQSSAIVKISTHETVINGDLEGARKFIAEIVAKTVNAEMVGIWMLENNDEQLVSKERYSLSHEKHIAGSVLEVSNFPNYFRALHSNIAINANDACKDVRTSEFCQNYLKVNNITSMLDSAIRESGKTIGVICIEHCGKMREWTDDEISFALHAAEQVSVVLSNYKQTMAELALRKSEEQYRTLMENLNEAVMMVDNNDRVLFVNKKFTEWLGYTQEEILGKIGYKILLSKEDQEKIIKANNERIERRSNQYEAKFIKKDGETIDFLISGSPVFDDEGNVIGSLGTMADITERLKAEEALRISEEMYRKLVATVPDLIIRTDLEGNIVFVNESAIPSLRFFPAENLLGKNMFSFISKSDQTRAKENFQKKFHGSQGIVEYSLEFEGGIKLSCEVNGEIIRDEQNNPVELVYVIRDITERKITEETIKTKSENFKRIFDLAPYGMVITKISDNRVLTVNKEFCSITELEPEKVIGKKGSEFMNDDSIHLIEAEYSNTGKVNNFEQSLISKYGIPKTVLINSIPIEYDSELCILTVLKDITEQKNHEIELDKYRKHLEELIKERTGELEKINVLLQEEIIKQKEAEKKVKKALEKEKELSELKTKFISIASHEFRTPLATMYSSTELLEIFHNAAANEKFFLQIERIRRNIHNLTEIMDDVLVISRADSGKIKCEATPLDFEPYMQSIIDDTKVLLTKNHSLEYNFIYKPEKLIVDDKLFRIILMNLLSNAIKYSPNGGKVELEVSESKNLISFNISDQGIGIPEKDLKHLFEPFHRADNVGNIRGTGLGLSIVKKYVELHKGKLKVSSKTGKGTKFTILIPKEN